MMEAAVRGGGRAGEEGGGRGAECHGAVPQSAGEEWTLRGGLHVGLVARQPLRRKGKVSGVSVQGVGRSKVGVDPEWAGGGGLPNTFLLFSKGRPKIVPAPNARAGRMEGLPILYGKFHSCPKKEKNKLNTDFW